MKLFKFSASWCGPCAMQESIIKNLGSRINVPIERIDIESDTGQATTRVYGVRGVPTLILFGASGEEIKRHTGLLKEADLLTWLNEEEQ